MEKLTLATLIIEQFEVIVKFDNITQTIAIVATAVFTAMAAWAAKVSAEASKQQLEQQVRNVDHDNFFGVLAGLEKAHQIAFLSRGGLYENLRNSEELVIKYRKITDEANHYLEQLVAGDIFRETSPNIVNGTKRSPEYYEQLVDYARELCHDFMFDFVITSDTDFIKTHTGFKLPIDHHDPDKFIFTINTVINEILGYKDSSILQDGVSITRNRESGYFDAFKAKYTDISVDQTSAYQYIRAD